MQIRLFIAIALLISAGIVWSYGSTYVAAFRLNPAALGTILACFGVIALPPGIVSVILIGALLFVQPLLAGIPVIGKLVGVFPSHVLWIVFIVEIVGLLLVLIVGAATAGIGGIIVYYGFPLVKLLVLLFLILKSLGQLLL
jgi:hypothetical protein